MTTTSNIALQQIFFDSPHPACVFSAKTSSIPNPCTYSLIFWPWHITPSVQNKWTKKPNLLVLHSYFFLSNSEHCLANHDSLVHLYFASLLNFANITKPNLPCIF